MCRIYPDQTKEPVDPWQDWPLYIHGLLKVLSYFLCQADTTHSFAACQEPVFAFMSYLFPRNVRRARIAMKNYLDRVEPKS